MHTYHTSLVGCLGTFLILFWIIGLGLATIAQKPSAYMHWTRHTLSKVLHHSWKLILAGVIGYVLALAPQVAFSF